MTTAQLLWRADHPEKTPPPRPGVPPDDPKVKSRWYRVEFHRRLALPTSCLVLALVGIPLGLSSKKGGKSTGFVLTILLVFAYYLISLMGISFGRGGKLSPGLGVWMSDIVFLIAGLVLMWRVDKQPIELGSLRGWWNRFKESFQIGARPPRRLPSKSGAFERTSSRHRIFSARFPLILDDMVLRDFSLYLALIMMTFLMLTLVFTFFELLSDIVRNRVPLTIVADYLVNVTPSMIYTMMPLSVLLAVLITFGLMQRIERDDGDKGQRHQHLPHDRAGDSDFRRDRRRALYLRSGLHSVRQQAAGDAAQHHQGETCPDLPAARS